TTYEVPPDLEDITNADDQLLVEFTGWYTDAQFKHKYMPTRLNSDITLYAGYIAHSVKVTFISTNAMTDSGYVYLTSIYPKYYEGNVDFTSSELQEAILELNTDHYATGSGDYLFSYNPSTDSVGNISTETATYVGYIDKYFSIAGFGTKESNGEVVYTLDDVIDTPKVESVYYVIFEPKEVKVTFNSNMQGLGSYYESLGGNPENYTDQTVNLDRDFKDSYTLLNYASYGSLGFTNVPPTYHKFLGWTSLLPTDPDFGKEGTYYPFNTTVKIDEKLLNNNTEVTLYAVWQVIDTGIVINTNYDKNDVYDSVKDSISMGESKTIDEIITSLNLDREGYALIGFNSKADGTGEIVKLEDTLVGNRTASYYDKESDSLILYAVYKKIVDNIYIYFNDDTLDSVDYTTFVDEFDFDLNFYSYEGENDSVVTYDYDTTAVTIDYDISINGLKISNLIEGASFVLPSLPRSNYSLDKYIGVDSKEFNPEREFVLSSDLFTIGTSDISLQATWRGQTYALKFYKDVDDRAYQPVAVSYGSSVYIISTSSIIDETTTKVVTALYNSENNTLVSGSTFETRITGYSFLGWYGDVEDEETKFQNQTPFIVNSQLNEIFANWVINTYDITYYFNGGTYNGSTDVFVDRDIEYNTELELIGEGLVTRDGYYFEGWSLTQNNGETQNVDYAYTDLEYTITNDVQLYAVWTQKYFVNLYLDADKSKAAQVTVSRDNKFIIAGTEIAGYTFSRFNTLALGSGDEYLAGADVKTFTLEEDLNLYAMWFEVNFVDGNDGNLYGTSGDAPESFFVTYGTTFGLPENTFTSSKFFKFNNWNYDEDNKAINYFEVTEEMSGFAKTAANVGKTLMFKANWIYKNVKVNVYSNANKTTLTYSILVDVNAKETLTLASENNQFPLRADHQVDYFADGEVAYYVNAEKANISVPKPSDDLTYDSANDVFVYNIYAMWKSTVTYVANNRTPEKTIVYVGSTYSDANSNGKIELTEINEGFVVTLIENTFEYENRQFAFWGELPNSTEGHEEEATLTVAEDLTLYAGWEYKNYEIKFVDSQNNISNITFKYGEIKSLTDAGFTTEGEFTSSYEDTTDNCYKEFAGFTYNNGQETLTILPTDSLTFATVEDGGFIANNEFDTDNIINFTTLWTEKQYVLVVDFDGGSLQNVSVLDGFNVEYKYNKDTSKYELRYPVKYSEVNNASDGLQLVATGFTKDMYRFNGFVTDASKNSVSASYVYKFALGADEFEANGGDTISVKWQEVYTLEYNGNGASRCEIDNTQLDAISGVSTFEIPADQIEADKMAYPYAGVTFVGWWFTDDVEDITANIADIYTWGDSVEVTRDLMNEYGNDNVMTLYAVWKTTVRFQTILEGVNVTKYHTPAGETAGANTYFDYEFYCGDVVTSEDLLDFYFEIDSDGFMFSGWTKETAPVQEITINQPVTLTASWTNSFINVYLKNYNGEDFATPVVINILYDPTQRIDLNELYCQETSSVSMPSRYGYIFLGWKEGLSNTTVTKERTGEVTYYNNANKY
ncbi:MAG: InlB B-repeat-containing protein, partial [Clostridia bacterium]|nr:InlB B-repeat-containing protein [Clostridia bacterium]